MNIFTFFYFVFIKFQFSNDIYDQRKNLFRLQIQIRKNTSINLCTRNYIQFIILHFSLSQIYSLNWLPRNCAQFK